MKRKRDPCEWKATNYKSPHEYIMRSCDPELAAEIERNGVIELFEGRRYRYLYKDGYKYWVVHPVINRAKIEDVKRTSQKSAV